MNYMADFSPPFTLALVRGSGQSRRHPDYLRRAVRAVVLKDGRCLMTYSAHEGDYKFPGGGVLPAESHRQALARELLEETGYTLRQVKTILGTAIELDFSEGENTSVFRMISFYYLCEIHDEQGPLSLDPYEEELGFTPRWVMLRNTLQNNEQLARQGSSDQLFWLARETAVLRKLIESGLG
jgi:8-oxo-dGTP pyrophosphatase MutT (NUDIX family)